MERALRAQLLHGRFEGVSEKRSQAMRAVKGRKNKTTEMRLRSALVRASIHGWKMRMPGTLGMPDFIFPREKVAVFTDGCFWHGCPRCYHSPIKSNTAYWTEKIKRNISRDRRVNRRLRNAGWRVLRFWEHELKRSLEFAVVRIQKEVSRVREELL